MKDQLFLLRPGFFNASGGPLYCADCACLEGYLSFFPILRTIIDVHYIDFPRPRRELVSLIGSDNQSVPVLVIARGRDIKQASVSIRQHEDCRFIDTPSDIRNYLSSQYGIAEAA
jgi:hypothetical protein